MPLQVVQFATRKDQNDPRQSLYRPLQFGQVQGQRSRSRPLLKSFSAVTPPHIRSKFTSTISKLLFFAKYDYRTLYGALVVTLAVLWRQIDPQPIILLLNNVPIPLPRMLAVCLVGLLQIFLVFLHNQLPEINNESDRKVHADCICIKHFFSIC